MKNKIITITGFLFVGIMSSIMVAGVILNNIGSTNAADIPPEQVLLHQNSIKAAQSSNAIHLPKLHEEQMIVNANNATATSSRKIICTSFPDYCTQEFLNPAGAEGIDIEQYKTSFQ